MHFGRGVCVGFGGRGGVYTHVWCGVSYSCGNRTGDVPHQQQQRLIVGGESVKEELTPPPVSACFTSKSRASFWRWLEQTFCCCEHFVQSLSRHYSSFNTVIYLGNFVKPPNASSTHCHRCQFALSGEASIGQNKEKCLILDDLPTWMRIKNE